MGDDTQTRLYMLQQYKEAVLAYEQLDQELDDLLQSRGGHTKNLNEADYARYRELANQRDVAFDHMKTLEQVVLGDEN